MRHGYKFDVFEKPDTGIHMKYYVFNDDEHEARLSVEKHVPIKKPTEIKKIKEISARLFHIQNIPFGWCGIHDEEAG